MRLPALQDPVAAGLIAYVRARFRVRIFGSAQLRIEPGQIIAPSHRSDNDVPVLVAAMYPAWSAAVARGEPWPTFGAMVELSLPGFFAGYPPGLPLAVRRRLWPYQPGAVLERHLQCVPVREPHRMRLQELLRPDPDARLDRLVPAGILEGLVARSAALGRPPPVYAREVLDGAHVDLLWAEVDDLVAPEPPEVWREHARVAVRDFRRLGAALARGGTVVMFPEGDLSANGEIGPARPGLASLARRGAARSVQPVALAYDPLVSGRRRAYVSFAPALEPVAGQLRPAVTRALRAATPLTPGQLAAAAVLAGVASRPAFERSAVDAVARAHADGRPVEPALEGSGRGRTLAYALARARRLGPEDPVVRRLARELASAAERV